MFRRAIVVFAALAAALKGQWLHQKTPGIPRLPDGKPNLSAPAPRTADGKPDLSGFWRDDTAGTAEASKALDAIKPLPWAVTLYEKRKENLSHDFPGTQCLPAGPVVDLGLGKIVQTPNLIVMLYGGTLYRSIFLDGRQLPEDPNPSWMGYSIGHWDGDTLVIESNGFNDRTWLDYNGHPHTEALRLTERLRRRDFGHIEVVKTYTDPGALKEAWTIPLKYELDADTEDIEYVCNENERDSKHLIGKASDEKSVTVAPEILTKYAGTYAMKIPETGQIMDVTFAVDGDHLKMSGAGPTAPLISKSDTEFAGAGATFVFGMDEKGAVTHVIMKIVEGDFDAIRKP